MSEKKHDLGIREITLKKFASILQEQLLQMDKNFKTYGSTDKKVLSLMKDAKKSANILIIKYIALNKKYKASGKKDDFFTKLNEDFKRVEKQIDKVAKTAKYAGFLPTPDATAIVSESEKDDTKSSATTPTAVVPVKSTAVEPLAEEPLAEEPLAEEPLAEEPLAEEPLAEDTGNELLDSSLRSLNEHTETALMKFKSRSDEDAAYVRKIAVTLSIILQDPEMQLNLALLVISGAHFLADVIYNTADVALITGRALGPFARKAGYVGATFASEATMVAFGTALSLIPGVGPLLGGWVNLTAPAMGAAGEVIWNFPGILQRWEAIGEPIGKSVGSMNELTNQISGFTKVLENSLSSIVDGPDCVNGDRTKMDKNELEQCEDLLNNLKKVAAAQAEKVKENMTQQEIVQLENDIKKKKEEDAATKANQAKLKQEKKEDVGKSNDQQSVPPLNNKLEERLKKANVVQSPPLDNKLDLKVKKNVVPSAPPLTGGLKNRKRSTHKRRKTKKHKKLKKRRKTKKHKKLKKRRKTKKHKKLKKKRKSHKKKKRRKKGTKKRALR